MDISEIKKFRAEATPGPWEACDCYSNEDKEACGRVTVKASDQGICDTWEENGNTHFIAALPQIADECIRLAEENERLKEKLGEIINKQLKELDNISEKIDRMHGFEWLSGYKSALEDVKNLIKKRG